MKLTKLQKHHVKKEELTKEAGAILDNAKRLDRELTTVERDRLNAISRELDTVNAEIDIGARLLADKSASSILDWNVGCGTTTEPVTRTGGGRGRGYAQLFGLDNLSMDGWASSEDFFAAVASERAHPLLKSAIQRNVITSGEAMATQLGSVPSSGGFAVPEQLVAGMMDASLENEIVRGRADVQPMSSDTRKVWGFTHSDASSSTLFGGFSGQWLGEADTIDPEDAKLRMIELHAHKLAILTQASNELIADGGSFEEQLQQTMIKAMGWFLDNAFLNGVGAGQPTGVLNDPALIAVSAEDGQGASTVIYDNCVKMYSRIHPSLVEGAVWVVNPGVLPQLLTMTIAVGTGGSHIRVLNEDNGKFFLLGLPVLRTEKLPALGTQGDILLANFGQYVIGMRQGMSVDKSGHLGFASDTSHYRSILRADGFGKWDQAYTPKAGDSQSWAVVLEAR